MISLRQESSRVTVLVATVLVCFIAAVRGWAEEPAPSLQLFAVPSPALRSLESQRTETVPAPAPKDTPLPASPANDDDVGNIKVEFTRARTISEEARTQMYEGLNGPILTQVEVEPEPAGALGWVQMNMWDPIFTLEAVRIRKVYITGSIITAIQRKNPLCLLNPLVLAVDW